MRFPLPRRPLLLGLPALAATRGAFAAEAAKPRAKPAAPRIGVALPLSGAQSLLGDEALRGIQLAADEIGLAGGIAGAPVGLTTADEIYQAQAASAVNRLAGAHMAVLLSASSSALSYPATAAAELAQLPCIELIAPADGLTRRGFKFLLRTAATTSMTANLAVATLLKRHPEQKCGLLFNTGATGGAIAAAALSAFNAAKRPPVLSIGYAEDATDLFDATGRLMRAGVQMVLHAAGAADTLGFFAAMQAQGWRPPTLLGCGDGYAFTETAYALGAALEGTLVAAPPFYPPTAAPVARAYRSRFGMDPRAPQSLTAYVGARLVFSTLAGLNGDASRLLDTLRKADIAKGGLANGWGAAFDGNGQNARAFVTLQQWRAGHLVPADPPAE